MNNQKEVLWTFALNESQSLNDGSFQFRLPSSINFEKIIIVSFQAQNLAHNFLYMKIKELSGIRNISNDNFCALLSNYATSPFFLTNSSVLKEQIISNAQVSRINTLTISFYDVNKILVEPIDFVLLLKFINS